MSTPKPKRDKQAGKALLRLEGDRLHILFPDGGAPSKSLRLRNHKDESGKPHGSHHNGRHKLG